MALCHPGRLRRTCRTSQDFRNRHCTMGARSGLGGHSGCRDVRDLDNLDVEVVIVHPLVAMDGHTVAVARSVEGVLVGRLANSA